MDKNILHDSSVVRYCSYLFIAFCLAASMWIGDYFNLTSTRATAVLCVGLSPMFLFAGYLIGNRWCTRIGIATLPVAVVLWLINSNLLETRGPF